jgi:hypothetical protein
LALLTRPQTGIVVVATAAVICAVGSAIALLVACLTDPPPDLPSGSTGRPEIIHDALSPYEGLLTQWPADNEFVVPIELADPAELCAFSVYVDGALKFCSPSSCTGVVDGGVVLLPMPALVPSIVLDPAVVCPHTVRVTVARQFSQGVDVPLCAVPDSAGGDTATWEFTPPGCSTYDAGAFGDGAFPIDAPVDTVLVVPDSAGDP